MFIIIKDTNITKTNNLDREYVYKGIHIYRKNKTCYIELSSGYYFSDNSKSKELKLKEYTIFNDKNMQSIHLYVYESDSGFNDYRLYKNTDLIITNNQKANIFCKDKYLNNKYLSIRKGVISSNFEVLVDGCLFNMDKLYEGSIIEFLGIRIYYFENFLYINSFGIDVSLERLDIKPARLKYVDEKLSDNYYIPEDIYNLEIPEIVEYKPIKKVENIEFIKSLVPNSIMSISMSFMALINYQSSLVNNPDTSIISYIVMPISMAITSTIMPIIFTIISNNKNKNEIIQAKKEYIQYLDEYKQNLSIEIDKYIRSLNSRFFDLFNSKKMMFYANPASSEYLKLSIGKATTSKKIDIKYYGDKQIDDKLLEINETLNNIQDYPLFVDLKINRKVTIVSKTSDKWYFFNSVLLELAYKHHYDDINIAVYSKDKRRFDNFYNLPHLFHNAKRLTLINDEQLQLFDQTKFNKPVILLMYDKSNITFGNENIHQIYFSTSILDILKDSNSIVEYINNEGYIYADKKTRFKYISKIISFSNYFNYIGKLKTINYRNGTYHYNDIFDLDIKQYYKQKSHDLCASFAFNNSEIVSLDLHESKHGPHGLIGGSTGSGKSELIISLLLSLCIRYSPDYLNIVLIDYKGGGIKESLSFNGVSVPHIVASVSNLENNSLERLIIALNNECKRRQNSFKALSSKTNISIMNIDDYIENIKPEYGLVNIPHLFIVVDEFAELKKENPEQIKELISISRIGRSLGVHLILATQKPSGVIDDEIWSNSRFKIALKVFDEKDSQDIIKSKDAAYLNNPGSFIMRVDSSLIKGQAIYSKADVNNNDPIRISLLNNQLEIEKTYKYQRGKPLPATMYYCQKILEASALCKPKKLDFLAPANKDRHKLTNSKCLVMGEIDDYINGKKGLLAFGFRQSILIYSLRKNEINSILNTLNENRIQNIVIGADKYNGLYTSDSIAYDNSEDILYLFELLLSNTNNNLNLVIEDVNTLLSYDENYLNILCKLVKRAESINLSLIFITTSTQISFKLINVFKNKVQINVLEQADVMSFYGMRSKYVGNSYYFDSEPISFVPIKQEMLIENKPIIPSLIKHIPETIKPSIDNGKYLVGYDVYSRQEVYASSKTIILSLDEGLLDLYRAYKQLDIQVYDYKTNINSNEILWLGSGIFSQRIFVTGLKEDLDETCGIYIKNNKKQVIRSINYVSNINEI